MIIGVGLIEKGLDDKCYNTWVACMPDGTYHAHRNSMLLSTLASTRVIAIPCLIRHGGKSRYPHLLG